MQILQGYDLMGIGAMIVLTSFILVLFFMLGHITGQYYMLKKIFKDLSHKVGMSLNDFMKRYW